MEFKGVVTDVQDKSGTSKKGEAFNACQFVVEEQKDRYPQSAVFDMFGDKVPVPAIGEEVTVHFSMKATEWNGKYFGKNNVWKITHDEPGTRHASAPPAGASAPPDDHYGSPAAAEPAAEQTDLPF